MKSMEDNSSPLKADPIRQARRRLLNEFASGCIGVGGISIILAVLLIFVFLLLEIIPLFEPAGVSPLVESRPLSQEQRLLAVDLDERGDILYQLFESGQGQRLAFYKNSDLGRADATPISEFELNVPVGAQWIYDTQTGWFAAQSDGVLHLGRLAEKEVFDSAGRSVEPVVSKMTPIQGMDLLHGSRSSSVELLNVSAQSKFMALSYRLSSGDRSSIHLQIWKESQSFLSKNIQYRRSADYDVSLDEKPLNVYVDKTLRWAYFVYEQSVNVYQLKSGEAKLYESVKIDSRVTTSQMLLGQRSLLLGDADGGISQWSLVRNEKNQYRFKSLRRLQLGSSPILQIQPEDRRRGFYALDQTGLLGAFFTTSERLLASWRLTGFDINSTQIVSSPRSNRLVAFDPGQIAIFDIDNQHPEVSFKSIWQKVWYEGYDEPEYIWQSTAATNDFEPKLSLSPLAYGTLKASFYAMLFALPLALCGAIYTAYFMAPKVRQIVKPAIEFMEALPTVILGFLAGIWLAPLVESYLTGVMLTLVLLPVVILLVSFCWFVSPRAIRHRLPDGWEPVLLMPFVIVTVYVCFSGSYPLERFLFDGNVQIWMRETLGVDYDQRNSLVVGIAMGFAIIPTIFSIAEDAVFGVPKSLTFGSLALGASSWQTLVRVVIPTASPGIFSAVMIGTGRAVGETMIVLMATGSTPIMDMNIFEGFRSLSANIAIEMPEAEVHSTHYRLLFFAAFCLFMMTFFFNTTAEIVRQRLREKYGSL